MQIEADAVDGADRSGAMLPQHALCDRKMHREIAHRQQRGRCFQILRDRVHRRTGSAGIGGGAAVKSGRNGAPFSASVTVTGLWQATAWVPEIAASPWGVMSEGLSRQQTS